MEPQELILLFIASSVVTVQSASPSEAIPSIYGKPCGDRGLICDGRVAYCDENVPGNENCGLCDRICHPDGVLSECQRHCQMYLQYNHEVSRDAANLQKMADTVDNKLGTMKHELLEQSKDLKTKIEIQEKIIIAGLIIVFIVVVTAVVLIAFALHYNIRTFHIADRLPEHNRTHYFQPAENNANVAAQEEGYGTGSSSESLPDGNVGEADGLLGAQPAADVPARNENEEERIELVEV